MTDKELKELAEFGAEFLGWSLREKYTVYGDAWVPPTKHQRLCLVGNKIPRKLSECFFFDDTSPQLIAHLAEEKIRENSIEMKYRYENGAHYWNLWGRRYGDAMDSSSKYIALWLAIREAVKNDS